LKLQVIGALERTLHYSTLEQIMHIGTSKDISHSQFERTVMPHRSSLFYSAMRMFGSADDADDLAQETVIRAWRFWSGFEPETNCQAWLHRILFNTFITNYRRKIRERDLLNQFQQVVELSSQLPHGDPVEDQCLSDEVQKKIGALPEQFRSVLMLVDIRGFSYSETAQALDCPVGTVMSRLHRARQILKKSLRTYAKKEGYS